MPIAELPGRNKGTDFHQAGQRLFGKVGKLLNNRPRKCLNYRTPAEVF